MYGQSLVAVSISPVGSESHDLIALNSPRDAVPVQMHLDGVDVRERPIVPCTKVRDFLLRAPTLYKEEPNRASVIDTLAN